MQARGLDIYEGNTPTLANLQSWRADGFCMGAYRMGIGSLPDKLATSHRSNLLAAGYMTFPYHALHPQAGVAPERQADLLVDAWSEPQVKVLMPDIEIFDLTRQVIMPYLRRLRDRWPYEILLYTNQSRWYKYFPSAAERAAVQAEIKMVLMVAGYPHDRPDYVIGPNGTLVYQGQLMDPLSVALRSHPPVLKKPALPTPYTEYLAWQHTGHGRLDGYEHDLDLQVWAQDEAALRARYGQDEQPVPPAAIDQIVRAHAQGILAETE